MQEYIKQTKEILNNKPMIFNNINEYQAQLHEAAGYLAKNDKVLKNIITKIGSCRLKPHKKYFENLVDGIVSQQLSVRVAEVILQRFKNLFSGGSVSKKFPLPGEIILMDDEKLRACGLSYPKVKYVKDLARHVHEGKIKIHKMHSLPDDEVINELIQVKGIGVWTAQMFLIFCLGRMNVLPVGDLGLKRAVMINYKLRKLPGESKLEKISKQNSWHPYNSIATWYLWQSLSIN